MSEMRVNDSEMRMRWNNEAWPNSEIVIIYTVNLIFTVNNLFELLS